MRIGSLTIPTPLFLSPLAGYTNLPFRLVVREVGGVGLCTTDLVNARSLLEKNPKAFKLIETNAADTPLAVQLFGSVPEEMRDAAQFLESLGVASVDINMGCPVKKVVKIGDGNFHGVDHAANERRSFVQLCHHRRAAADLDDFFHGATHVDIHARHAARFEELRRIAHLFRYAAE